MLRELLIPRLSPFLLTADRVQGCIVNHRECKRLILQDGQPEKKMFYYKAKAWSFIFPKTFIVLSMKLNYSDFNYVLHGAKDGY